MEKLFLEKRIREILMLLMENNRYMTSEELAIKLGSSARTVREDISRYKQLLKKYGIYIHSKARLGYCLELEPGHDKELGSLIKQADHAGETDKKIRVMLRFLRAEGCLKLDDIAEELWVSRSTMDRLFKEVKEEFGKYHLTLVSKPFHGMRLEGSELNRRLCLVQCGLGPEHMTLEEFWAGTGEEAQEEHRILSRIMEESMQAEEYQISDMSRKNLLIHLSVALMRVRERHLLQDQVMKSLDSSAEYRIAVKIAEGIRRAFQVKLPEAEIAYIQMHLKGKRFFLEAGRNQVVTAEVERLMALINEEIKEQQGFDFGRDLEHFAALSLHLTPMVTRLRYGLHMSNPILEDIKRKLPIGYECAVTAAGVLSRELGCRVAEEELGYLAMHYTVAVERLREAAEKRIAVLCSSGLGTSRLMKYKIRKKFRVSDKNICMVGMEQLDQFNWNEIDYVFSTVPIERDLPCQVIYVENLLDDLTVEEKPAEKSINLAGYLSPELVRLQLRASSREEVIQTLYDALREQYELPEDFLENVWKREHVSATEIGDMVALPHPAMLCTRQSMLAAAVLKKPLIWSQKPVRYVFLVSYGKDNQEETERLNRELIRLVTNEEWRRHLAKVETYEEFQRLL